MGDRVHGEIMTYYETKLGALQRRVSETMEAWPDDDLHTTVEEIVFGEGIDLEESLRVLISIKVLPSSREVDKARLTPCYKEAISRAAEVSLIAEIIRRIKEDKTNDTQ